MSDPTTSPGVFVAVFLVDADVVVCTKKFLHLLAISGVGNYFCEPRSLLSFDKGFFQKVDRFDNPGIEGWSNLGRTLSVPCPAHTQDRLKSSSSYPAVIPRLSCSHPFLFPCLYQVIAWFVDLREAILAPLLLIINYLDSYGTVVLVVTWRSGLDQVWVRQRRRLL
jgi:hypothetical protein